MRLHFSTYAPLLLLCSLLLVFGTGCSGVEIKEDRDAAFSQAVEASLSEDEELATAAAWYYLKGANEDDPKYDRALNLMAQNAERMGLSYAASMWYLEIASARRDTTLVNQAVQGLEEIFKKYPYDMDTLLKGFVATAEITSLADEQTGFVAYHQGLNSLRRGHLKWAERQFAQIPPTSPYSYRAVYVMIVRELALGKFDQAQESLEELRDARDLPDDLALDIDRTLARLAFDQQRWPDALEAYENLREEAPGDPQLLLEMAWTHFYMGHYQRALGLLIALDAPAYNGLIAPERYLLEALSLRKLCQFEPARRAAVRLRKRHGRAIADLYAGVPLLKSDPLRQAARRSPGGEDVAKWRARLKFEQALLEENKGDLGEDLAKALEGIYAQGLKESSRREDAVLYEKMKAVSQDLLSAEEGVRLILHELGVALLRGRKRGDGAAAAEDAAKIDDVKEIAYRFDGEFWTDEIDDIVVQMEDRCID